MSVNLSPVGGAAAQFFDDNGNPLSGGKLYTYAAGTTTPLAAYTTSAGDVAHTNPIIFDAAGRVPSGEIWLTQGLEYKFGLFSSTNLLIATFDNIPAINDQTGLLAYEVLLASSAGSNNIGFIQSGLSAVARTAQNKMRETVSPQDFGAIGNGTTDDSVALTNTIANGKNIDLLGLSYLINSKQLFNQIGQTIYNGTLIFNGPITSRLADVTASNVTFENVVFHGNSKQPRSALVYVDTAIDQPKFHNCTFKEILCVNNGTTVLNQTYGLLINPYAVTNFEVIGCTFKNLTKYNDGVTGTPITAATVGLGFIGGICFMKEDLSVPLAAQPIPTAGIVQGSLFENIQTILAAGLSLGNQSEFNDADAIRTYGEPGGAEQLNVAVSDCVFRNCSKRAFKFRASGSTANNCEIYADGMQYGMIVPIDVTSNARIVNVNVYASSAKPVQSGVQWSIGPNANKETLIQGLYISHCIAGIGFFSNPTNQTLENFICKDIFINQASVYGLVGSSPFPLTQNNIVFDGVQIFGSGNACQGVVLPGSSAAQVGNYTLNNVYMKNASLNVQGVNNTLSDVTVEIESSSFVGASTSALLFRVGQNGSGGFQNVANLFINAGGLNTGFLNATRTQVGILIGSNASWRGLRIKLPEGLNQAYNPVEIYGSDWNLDGLTFDSPGNIFIGTTVASVRWAVKNAVRLGNGASESSFLYTANAGTGNGLFENITDFRPTTASTITINNGLGVGNRFIVTNVASKTSNATIVQNGGLATVVNAINFP